MKTLGLLLFTVGIALFVFLLYSFIRDKNKTISPLPDDRGVKVIFVTPEK